MKISNKQCKLVIVSLLFILLLVINLAISLRFYNLDTLTINHFFFVQTKQQYSKSGKIFYVQVFRESKLNFINVEIVYCDTCKSKQVPVKVIYSTNSTVQYFKPGNSEKK